MNKTLSLLVLVILVVGLFAISGCTVSQSKSDSLLGTQKTETTVGPGGVQTTQKDCPFWNRDC